MFVLPNAKVINVFSLKWNCKLNGDCGGRGEKRFFPLKSCGPEDFVIQINIRFLLSVSEREQVDSRAVIV